MQKKAVLAIIASGILWGIIQIFVGNLSNAGLSSIQIACIRMTLSAVLMVLFLLIKDKQLLRIHLRDCWMFLGTGVISVAFMNITYFYTIVHGEASIAVVLLYTSPVFVMLFSYFLFKEALTIRKIIALILTLLGCILTAGLYNATSSITPFVLLTGIGAGLFYGLYSIFSRYALQKYHPLTITAWTFVFSSVCLLCIGDLGGIIRILTSSPASILSGFGITIFSTILPYALYTYGLEKIESGRAAILVAIEPLVGSLLGILVYKESCELLKLLGIGLTLCALMLMNLPEKRLMQQSSDSSKASEAETK